MLMATTPYHRFLGHQGAGTSARRTPRGPPGLPLLFICFMPRVVKLSRFRHTFLSSMVAVASLFLFPFRIVNFIQCVGNLVQKHQVRSTHAAETFD